MSLIIIVLFALSLSVGGFFMKRDAKKSENPANKIFGQLFLFGGIAILTIGLAHAFLHKTAWTDDKKQMFLYILIAVVGLYSVAMSVLFGLKARKENNKIGFLTWSILAILVLAGGVSSFSKVSHMNDGWTRERENRFLDGCHQQCPNCDSNATRELMDCNCQLKFTKQYFPNPEDYNAAKSDEEAMGKYNKFLKANCNVCDSMVIDKMSDKTIDNMEPTDESEDFFND